VSNLADKKKEAPDFDTIEDLAEFWDAHDSTDFTLKETCAVFERPELEQISIRLPKPVLAQLKALAQASGIGHTTLARVIITRHLSQKTQ